MPVKVLIAGGIISYPNLFVARSPKGSTTPRFGATIIMPENYDWSEIQQAVATVTAEKWGANPPNNLKSQIKVVDEGPYKGRYSISTTASAEHQPTAVDQSLQPIMNAADIFAGCICNFQVSVFAYDTGSSGVSMGLNMVQLVQNQGVQRLDSTQAVEDVFAVIPGGAVVGEQPMQQQPMQQPQQPMQQPLQQPMQQQQQPMQQPTVAQEGIVQQPVTPVVVDQSGIVQQPVAAQQIDPANPPAGIVGAQPANPWQ